VAGVYTRFACSVLRPRQRASPETQSTSPCHRRLDAVAHAWRARHACRSWRPKLGSGQCVATSRISKSSQMTRRGQRSASLLSAACEMWCMSQPRLAQQRVKQSRIAPDSRTFRPLRFEHGEGCRPFPHIRGSLRVRSRAKAGVPKGNKPRRADRPQPKPERRRTYADGSRTPL
jgi:hypothetical protein